MAHSADSTAAFPLYLHRASSNWCKTIRGRRYYFGKDKVAALEKWHKQKDDLLAGRKPSTDPEVVTIRFACNYCLTKKERLVESGELSRRQFADLKAMSDFLVEHFGANRSVASIGPDEFGELRKKMFARWAPSGLVSRIGNIKHIFRFAYDNDILKSPVKFGDQFKMPSKKMRRIARQKKGKRLFTAEDLRLIIAKANPHMKAFALLGLNAGLGNADIGKLTVDDIDLVRGWLDYPRPKTAVPRRAKLWPETCEAIQVARDNQPTSRSESTGKLLFLTRNRKAWSHHETTSCSISQGFRRLLRELDLYEQGKTFYALRHVFQTVGGEAKDHVALNYAMGHDDGSIANHYREAVSDERLEAVAATIYSWLFYSGGKAR